MATTGESRLNGWALALETSSNPPGVGCVALGRSGSIVEARDFTQPGAHAADMIPAIDRLCREHGVHSTEVTAVYVSTGPGSFTGLRIGITAAKMIALAVGAKVVGVPSLEVIAQNAGEAEPPPQDVAVMRDAKRGRVYAASFCRDGESYLPTSPPEEADPREFLARQCQSCAVLGDGSLPHAGAVTDSGLRLLPEMLNAPSAAMLYRLGECRARRGEFDDPRSILPLYIRAPDAAEKWDERHGGTAGAS